MDSFYDMNMGMFHIEKNTGQEVKAQPELTHNKLKIFLAFLFDILYR